jgi:single-strand DNA-binding protein
MLNNVILAGRIVGEIELEELENGGKIARLTLAIPRSYKNEEGIYETDFIDCVLWHTVAETTKEYCCKGDLIGIRGRIQTRNIENENGEKRKITEIIAERVTFLSSKKNEELDYE